MPPATPSSSRMAGSASSGKSLLSRICELANRRRPCPRFVVCRCYLWLQHPSVPSGAASPQDCSTPYHAEQASSKDCITPYQAEQHRCKIALLRTKRSSTAARLLYSVPSGASVVERLHHSVPSGAAILAISAIYQQGPAPNDADPFPLLRVSILTIFRALPHIGEPL